MKDFFEDGFGNEIERKVSKTSKKYQGQTVYKVDKKVDNPHLKKGDQFYLDNLHKDHIEVFDKQGNFRAVLDLDGNINIDKTKKALGRKLK
ncbi:hypothetical protein COL87_11330 [Bacillus pseudomycoides]|nr:hypothetical protein [Bacillus pseudomycoides]PGA71757.1 hypothetical protein COL87_11330 [Bacillus pseudomycoides]